ncbi:hypothetical protein Tco_0701094 [Tanacetum coccineum]
MQGVVISNWEAVDPFHVPYGPHCRCDVLSAVSARVDMVMAPFRSHWSLEDLGYLYQTADRSLLDITSCKIADKRGVLFRCDTDRISGLIVAKVNLLTNTHIAFI